MSLARRLFARYPRLARIGAITIATILLLLVLRLIWAGIAAHRLNAQLAAIEAAGDPTTAEQLFPPEDERGSDNAVPPLIDAMKAADAVTAAGIDSPAQSNLDYSGSPPYSPAWHQLANASALANAQALKLTRQSRGRPHVRWNILPATPIYKNVPMTHLNSARNLANAVGDAALHAHLHGDDVEAIERVRDVLHVGTAVGQQRSLVAHLVDIGIESLGENRLMIIAPGLRIGRDEQNPVRRRIRALIADLSDDAPPRAALHRALVAERVYEIDAMHSAENDVWITRPMYELDLARLLKMDDILLRAADESDVASARALLDTIARTPWPAGYATTVPAAPPPAAPRFTRSFSAMMFNTLDRFIEVNLRVRLERSMCAVSLAAQLYRADHGGLWPPTLDALLPNYLLIIPPDRYVKDRPLRYLLVKHALPDGGDRPIVYSVGPDGIADSAAVSPLPPEPQYSWSSGRGTNHDDQVRDLARWALPQPATQPSRP